MVSSTSATSSSTASNSSGGSALTHLTCTRCGAHYEPHQPLTVCTGKDCGKPLFAHYDLERAAQTLTKSVLASRPLSLWRYREVLPVTRDENIVSLGEGMTPLLSLPRLGASLGLSSLFVKDESLNPTGSFKARGLCMAVSMAKELGFKKLAVPSAGNAAGALAAYAARAGMEAHIFMPQDTPLANKIECVEMGAHVTLVDGLITACGAEVARQKAANGWWDVSTLKEPYRVEGKKTMGYELAEQLGWTLPDVILYPTGGGTGLVGMWKAFEEMERLGWIGRERPRMVSVQAAGCCPIVTAFERGEREATEHHNAETLASGLRVPKAIGDFIMLKILRESGGTAIAVTDEEMLAANREMGEKEGIFAAPEGGACLAALKELQRRGEVSPSDRIVLFNTGAGIKYLEAFQGRGGRKERDVETRGP